MRTLHLALAALLLGALSCIALGLAEFNARWLLDVRIEFQQAQQLTWLEYTSMWREPLFRTLLDPVRPVVSAMPVGAILLLHGWPRVQTAIVVMVLILLFRFSSTRSRAWPRCSLQCSARPAPSPHIWARRCCVR